MFNTKLLFASVILVGASLSPASAQEMEIFVANDTNMDIVDIGVSATGENDWFDLDQGAVLGPNSMFTFTVTPDEGCRFDFRGTFADGSEATITGVEVCQASQVGEVWASFN